MVRPSARYEATVPAYNATRPLDCEAPRSFIPAIAVQVNPRTSDACSGARSFLRCAQEDAGRGLRNDGVGGSVA